MVCTERAVKEVRSQKRGLSWKSLRLPSAVSVVVLMAVTLLAPAPASALGGASGNFLDDGEQTVAFSGQQHYSAQADVAFNEFCVENTSLSDGWVPEITSYVIYTTPAGRSVGDNKAEYRVPRRLGCFKHEVPQPAGTDSVTLLTTICAVHSSKGRRCQTFDEVYG